MKNEVKSLPLKKLTLQKLTIRTLNDKQLARVGGGGISTVVTLGPGCWPDPP
jgi:natural product precursor